MSAPKTLAEAQAQCRALGTDLRVSGAHLSACQDLMAPFCPHGVQGTFGVELPTCAGADPSAAKAAALLKEAEAKAGAPFPWLLVGGVVVAGLVTWLVIRKG